MIDTQCQYYYKIVEESVVFLANSSRPAVVVVVVHANVTIKVIACASFDAISRKRQATILFYTFFQSIDARQVPKNLLRTIGISNKKINEKI